MQTEEELAHELSQNQSFYDLLDAFKKPQQELVPDPADVSPEPEKTYLPQTPEEVEQELRRPKNILTKALDFITRGQYFMTKFSDVFANYGGSTDKAFKAASAAGWQEMVHPKERLSYVDFINKNFPQFAKDHPALATTTGIIWDVALPDPIGILGFGTKGIRKTVALGAEKVLSDEGIKIADAISSALAKRDMTAIPKMATNALNAVISREAAEAGDLARTLEAYAIKGKKKLDPVMVKKLYKQFEPNATQSVNALDKIHDTTEKAMEQLFLEGQKHLFEKKGLLIKIPFVKTFKIGLEDIAGKTIDNGMSAAMQWVKDSATNWKHIDKLEGAIRLVKKDFRFLLHDPNNPLKWGFTDRMYKKSSELIDLIRDENVIDNEALGHSIMKEFMPLAKKEDMNKLGHFLHVTDEAVGQIHRRNPGQYKLIGSALGVQKRNYMVDLGRLADQSIPDWERAVLTKLQDAYSQGQMVSPRLINNWTRTFLFNKALPANFKSPESAQKFTNLYNVYKRILDNNTEHLYALNLLKAKSEKMTTQEFKAIEDTWAYRRYKDFKAGRLDMEQASKMGLLDKFDQIVNVDNLGRLDHNAGLELALTTMNAKKKLHNFYREQNLKAIWGVNSIGSLPDEVRNSMRFADNINFSIFNRSPIFQNAARKIDAVNSFVKFFPTVGNPAFGIKNFAVQNPLQIAAALGAKMFGMFDMSSIKDAAIITAKRLHPEMVPDDLMQAVKHIDAYDGIHTLQDFHEVFQKYGVYQGATVARDKMEKSVEKMMKEAVFSKQLNNKPWVQVLKTVANYTNWPEILEDFTRTALGSMAIKAGHSPKDAVRMIDTALFPYRSGLSEFERQIGKRLAFFYSFPRFAIPLIAKTAINHPGRLQNINDVVTGIPKIWHKVFHDKEELTPSEQYMLGSDLVFSQPSEFEGFDKSGLAQMRTFPSLGFTDALDIVNFADTSKKSISDNISKLIMATLSPAFKMPIETLILNKKAFTDETIFAINQAKKKSLGSLDIETFTGLLAGLGGSMFSGLAAPFAFAGGKILGKSELAQDAIKHAFGITEGVDPYTNTKRLYINPAKMYFMTSMIPSMSKIVRIAQDDTSYMDKTLEILFGLPKYKTNLETKQMFYNTDDFDEVKKLQGVANYSAQRQMEDEYEQAMQRMEELNEDIMFDQNMLGISDVRGPSSLGGE